ncbi:hypothetical protein GC176_27490 [bacterium]|nr:hypothetical protein [bacterium]
MKRLALTALSVCAISFLSGCCWWPGYWGGCGTGCSPYGGSPFGGCPNGQCAPGGGYPGVAPTSYQTGYESVQTGYPIATQPVYTNTALAYPQPVQPTMALESLPTYR